MKSFVLNLTNSDVRSSLSVEDMEFISNSESILVQIFSGEKIEKIKNVVKEIKELFPKASCIGATTDGEIINGKVTIKNTIVSISVFKDTKLKFLYSSIEDDFEAGVFIAEALVSDKTKLLLTFADGLLTNGEEYLNGINSAGYNVMIAGGMAGDNAEFDNCFMICDDQIYNRGVVAVALDSDILKVHNFYNFGWDKIGTSHTITKSQGNRVYTIDDISAVDFYTRYLGQESSDELPATGIEFPLIKVENGVDIARAVIQKHDDGSLSFAGNMYENDKIYIGIGNSSKILSNSMQELDGVEVESFFIYSCMARRRYLLDLTQKELEPFASMSTVSGFFTYGEFYTKGTSKLLNETLTAVALSESTDHVHFKAQQSTNATSQEKTYKAICNIINQTALEYEEINAKLKEKVHEEKVKALNMSSKYRLLISSMSEGVLICNSKEEIVDINLATVRMFGYSREELVGMNIYDLSTPKSQKAIDECKENTLTSSRFETVLKTKDNRELFVIINSTPIVSESEIIRLTIIIDLTEIKQKDKQLLMQAKHAQMGEMINMIAHQWRQPLNAINASAIELSIKNELEMLESEHLEKSLQFIQNMTHKMSKTIDDFMNFSKPDHTRDMVKLDDILDEILGIITAQLTNHNIEIDIQNEQHIVVKTLKQELSHVLMNLIANARDALNELDMEDKKITIKSYKKDDLCYVEVLDNGKGVTSEIADKIFNPYFTTKEKGVGTGLGLYMSKKILNEVLDGDIEVVSSTEGGKFIVTLKDCSHEI